MLKQSKLENNVDQFMAFLELSDQNYLSIELQQFFSDNQQNQGKKEAIHNSNSLSLFAGGRLIQQFNLKRKYKEDRLIKFNGSFITDINLMAYISGYQSAGLQMKGDGSTTGGAGSTSTNNNNNNNNNS